MSRHLTRKGDGWEFWPNDGECFCSIAVIPFGTESLGNGKVSEGYYEEEYLVEYETALGYRPTQSIQMDNYCRNDPKGHKRLTEMAIFLSRKHNGLIEVGNAVNELVSAAEKTGTHLPGKRYILKYDPCWYEYLVDADFMQAWAEHSDFHLEI